MKTTTITVNNLALPVITLDTAVIGSGCAGFNAADWLYTFGRQDIAVLTEGVNMGTSRNTGSDKQTYYKLSLSGAEGDSVAAMAADLYSVGGVNGDTALAEAAGSARSFIKLANLGVPFPTNEYGEYVGYKTDHDPRQRATSAGPLTSRMMTEALERSVREKGIPILDGLMAIKILVSGGHAAGLLCLDKNRLDGPNYGLTAVCARNIILATGGPAGCYLRSVYPESQTGMSGMALEAGAVGANLNEWQYGLASLGFRWNVSGTYQQALPRYISVDKNGCEREFLLEYYDNPRHALDMVFLKGYQWPFDTEKIHGSSMIDILVHREAERGRRVYLDYRRNPTGLERGFDGLGNEARGYLENSGALFGTPIERLERMNRPAIELYRQNGIDLYAEPLEIGVCAQHHNGGLAVDANWQTSIPGLYAAGEAAGTFGAKRPGGSALNSTQVGSLRAAEHIAYSTVPPGDMCGDFSELAACEARKILGNIENALRVSCGTGDIMSTSNPLIEHRREMGAMMSACAGHIRDIDGMAALEANIEAALEDFFDRPPVTQCDLPELFKNRDILITQQAVLSAMRYAARMGSRGSALVLSDGGLPLIEGLKYAPNVPQEENRLIVTRKMPGGYESEFRPARPIPESEQWFESVWGEYRKRREKA